MSQLEQQMRHRDKEMVPRILVQAMFALMIASLALVAYAQWFDVPNRGVLVEAPVVQSLDIVMEGDRGGVYTVSTPDGTQIASSADEKGGFLGVMGRVVDRELPARVPGPGLVLSPAPGPARRGGRHRDARVHHQPCHHQQVHPDAPRDPATQTVLRRRHARRRRGGCGLGSNME